MTLCLKKLNDFKKRFNKLKNVDPQANENKVLKPKVLDNVGDLFNELYYIYKDKCKEEKEGLNTKNKRFFYYRKLSLTDDYQYKSEGEKQQTSKKADKKSEQPDELRLPEWIKVDKQRLDVIKKKAQNAKKSNLQVRPKGSKVININESNKLLFGIENGQITYEEALKRIKNICSNIKKVISMQGINVNQVNFVNILFMVDEIFTGKNKSVGVNKEGMLEIFEEKQESDEEPDTTDMPELESEKSASERRNQPGKGLKILATDQMLSRLPISLAQ